MLNSQSVVINYYIGQRTIPLSLLLVIVFAIGSLLGLLVSSWIVFKTKMQNHKLRKRLKLAEKEVENLRAIPLKDNH
jgi:putative membrane protein